MPDFSTRSHQKELLDEPNIPQRDIEKNLEELAFINTYLGGHATTLDGLQRLLGGKKDVTVCEIGCGGSDNLEAIYYWGIRNHVNVKCIGIDINPDCIAYADEHTDIPDLELIESDYRDVQLPMKPDIIFSSLLCHHLSDEQLVEMLHWCRDNSTLGFFINDLNRHPLVYYFIKTATTIFSRSRLVKNDAPISVLRGFKRNEWEQILQKAGIKKYSIEWKWAYRHLIVCSNEP